MKSGKKDLQRKIIVIFALSVGIIFAIEIVALPLSYRDDTRADSEKIDFSKKFEKTWIFDSNLTDEEKSYLMTNYKTIATYRYTDSPDFIELENLVNQFEGQIVIERVKSDKMELELRSMRESIVVENLTIKSLFEGFCAVMYLPPPDCMVSE